MADAFNFISNFANNIAYNIAGPKGPPGFTPSDLPNLVVWFDAQDTSTITKDISDKVSQWAGKEGNGNIGSAVSDPLFVSTAINGRPAIRFDGNDSFNGNKVIDPRSPLTIFSVVTLTGGVFPRIFDFQSFVYGSITGGDGRYRTTTPGIKDYTSTLSQFVIGVPQIMQIVFDNSFDVSYSKDGSFIETIAGTTQANPPGGIFRIGTAFGTAWVGDIGEIIATKSLLTAEQNTDTINYLKSRWGIS